MRVLVISDGPTSASLCAMLDDVGLEVEWAWHLEKGYLRLVDERFDAVLVDESFGVPFLFNVERISGATLFVFDPTRGAEAVAQLCSRHLLRAA